MQSYMLHQKTLLTDILFATLHLHLEPHLCPKTQIPDHVSIELNSFQSINVSYKDDTKVTKYSVTNEA